MKRLIIILLCLVTLKSQAQRSTTKRSSTPISINSFIGTWELKKYADLHLTYTNSPVKSETLRFTKDSIFIKFDTKQYSGTWKLEGSQPVINIKKTNKFNYRWIAGNIDSKFFTTKKLGYYKYFERISKE